MIDRRQDRPYQVPRRFGIGTILVVTALFATVCGIIKWTDTSPIDLVLYSSFVIVIGAAQIFIERSPRLGSILAGVTFLPISMFVVMVLEASGSPSNSIQSTSLVDGGLMFWMLTTGAVLGYIGGTLLAGIFLVVDKLNHAIQRAFKQSRLPTRVS